MEGIVVKFDDKRGFGFIRTKELPKDVFVHIQEVHEQQNLSRGQKVQFDTKQTTKGLSAVNVIPGAKQTSPFFLYGMTAVIMIIAASIFLFYNNLHIVIAYIVSVNLTTFLFYGYDKMIAGGSFLRVPELVLQGLSLSGGSPAGLIAQKFFRHKTVKGSFQLVYWAIVVVQVIVLAWFFLV
ncbi:MAG: hypothetical protein DRQ49_13660 [Gammaproteobacteria bacterium]|nr:MAG: hypothetical protein DRQ49_13660 [Gammaproteobacteria bacterium]RKZ38676.1 MAG: hypothetical protein DRQ41_11705 [Gammaproteobacteria bacterium]RKZ71645.1 MAG: hypothetical protein DRQ57_18395 [Gammaproteobacteria bacterium]